jgi:hypothetical protein
LHDAAFFERWGVPAAPVVTREFLQAGEFQAKALFGGDYPIVFTPHPVAHMEKEEFSRLAQDALEGIAGRLMSASS